MKKRYYFIIVYILFIIVLSISICKTLNPKKIGEAYHHLYEPLEYYSNTIETNMNEITISDDKKNWSQLKQTNLEDEKLDKTYNLLISDIRTCYLLSNDLENKTYSNIKILSFKDKTYVTDMELAELNENENCLANFDKYNSLILSDDYALSEKIKKQIRIIIDYTPESSTLKTFDELFYTELTTMSKIASLSNWLKVEYYSQKIS